MIKNDYAFLVVPISSKKLKKVFLSKSKLNLIAYSAIFAFSALTIAIVLHLKEYRYLKKVSGPILAENALLKKENRKLKEEKKVALYSMDTLKQNIEGERLQHLKRLTEVTEELEKLQKFVADLKILAGFKLPKEDALKLKGKGEGGSEISIEAYFDALKTLNQSNLPEEIDKKATELAKILRERRNSLKELRKFLENKHTLLAGRPKGWPLIGKVTSEFGLRNGGFHTGIDIAAPIGTPVFATGEGVVVFKGYAGGYGNLVEIDHGNGFSTMYAHLSRYGVKIGDRVESGDIVGYVGTSGKTTGPHLHYEVRIRGVPVNPKPYLE